MRCEPGPEHLPNTLPPPACVHTAEWDRFELDAAVAADALGASQTVTPLPLSCRKHARESRPAHAGETAREAGEGELHRSDVFRMRKRLRKSLPS